VSDRSVVYERPFRAHLDVPDFFYSLPFHYYTTSALVEAWFAAPSVTLRRQLINWPPFADAARTIACPVWKLFDFEQIPKALYTRPGTRTGSKKDSRASLHPRFDMIYRLLKRAVLSGHVRITWRPRFKLLVDKATESKSKSTACVIRRQLLLSLIFGDVRDVPAYKPLDAPFGYAYDFTSTVQEFDSMSRLDQWKTTLLLRAKKRCAARDTAGGDDDGGGWRGVRWGCCTAPPALGLPACNMPRPWLTNVLLFANPFLFSTATGCKFCWVPFVGLFC
jgi:hypothetical protein